MNPASSITNERTDYRSLDILGGVELLDARFIKQHFSRHFHEGYAVGCIEYGAMRFRYLGAGHVAPAGEINLVVPGEVHDGHAADERGWAYRMFYMSPETLGQAAEVLGLPHAMPHFRQGVIRDPALAGAIRHTHRLLFSPDAPTLQKESALLRLLAAWVHRHADDRGAWPDPKPEHVAARKARDWLHDHLTGDVRLDDLARVAALSPYHLLRVFERHYGLTPHAYLMQERVRLARRLLSGPARLADIAAEAGFADQAHMTRLFKARYGIPPARLRKFIQNS